MRFCIHCEQPLPNNQVCCIDCSSDMFFDDELEETYSSWALSRDEGDPEELNYDDDSFYCSENRHLFDELEQMEDVMDEDNGEDFD